MKIKAGVIGCGTISQFHFAGIAAAGAEVAWVCDINDEVARSHAARFKARPTNDYREVMADPAVNVVFILTNSRYHKAICLAAIEAGKAVICEKTLAENADDALEVVTAAERKGTIFYTSYMKRFIPAMEKAKELLPSCGKILATHIRSYQVWGDCWNPDVTDAWFCQPGDGKPSIPRALSGGGILIMGGSHLLDLICFLLGRPHRVYAAWETMPGRDHDEHTSVLLETSNGRVHLDVLCHPFTKSGFLRDGWDEQIEIIGDKGILHFYSATWNQGDIKACLLVHHDRFTGASTEYRYEPGAPFTPAVQFYLRNIEAGKQGTQSKFTGYDVDELIAIISRSSREHQALDIHYRIG
jgi:predicted dehydrogenase